MLEDGLGRSHVWLFCDGSYCFFNRMLFSSFCPLLKNRGGGVSYQTGIIQRVKQRKKKKRNHHSHRKEEPERDQRVKGNRRIIQRAKQSPPQKNRERKPGKRLESGRESGNHPESKAKKTNKTKQKSDHHSQRKVQNQASFPKINCPSS